MFKRREKRNEMKAFGITYPAVLPVMLVEILSAGEQTVATLKSENVFSGLFYSFDILVGVQK